jgi:nucleotide sugar dehydrogenase
MDERGRDPVKEVFEGKASIAVYGVGYVGLSLVAVFLRKGLRVIGVDVNENRLAQIQRLELWFNEREIKDAVEEGLSSGRLILTSDGVNASRESSIKIVTVPVLFDWLNKKFSYKPLVEVARTIGKGLKKGDMIILESSVPPGTTVEVLAPELEAVSNYKMERDFLLAYSPERVYIGRAVKDIETNYPKIVSGVGPRSLESVSRFYERIASRGVIKLDSTTEAEFEKLAEGIYRDVNIALANELALAAMRMGVNYFNIRKAANSQPYSHLHLPGPGVGGYCIPLYPYFMLNRLLHKEYIMLLTKTAREINEEMPLVVVRLVDNLRSRLNLQRSRTRIAILGVAFRGDIDDTRLSPTHDIVGLLKARGFRYILAHDPYVKTDKALEEIGVPLVNELNEALENANIIIVTTAHSIYRKLKLSKIVEAARAKSVGIVDTVNVIEKDIHYPYIITLGLGSNEAREQTGFQRDY